MLKNLIRLCVLFLALINLIQTTYAKEDDNDVLSSILQHMILSHKHYLYDNFMIEATLSDLNPIKISHGVFDNGSALMLSNLNGLPQAVLSYNNKVIYLASDSSYYAVENSVIPNLYLRLIGMNPDAIMERYKVELSGQSRVAGKLVQFIKLVPKKNQSYTLILGIDQNSGLLLQLDVMDEENKFVKRFMSVHMDILENNSDFLQKIITSLPESIRTIDNTSTKEKSVKWYLKNLPPYFSVVTMNSHYIRDNGEHSEYMLLTDGLSDVSIYLLEHKNEIRLPLASSNGVTVYRQRISDSKDIAVIGFIPKHMAKTIADSVVLQN